MKTKIYIEENDLTKKDKLIATFFYIIIGILIILWPIFVILFIFFYLQYAKIIIEKEDKKHGNK